MENDFDFLPIFYQFPSWEACFPDDVCGFGGGESGIAG
jgi:hypothetical protein